MLHLGCAADVGTAPSRVILVLLRRGAEFSSVFIMEIQWLNIWKVITRVLCASQQFVC